MFVCRFSVDRCDLSVVVKGRWRIAQKKQFQSQKRFSILFNFPSSLHSLYIFAVLCRGTTTKTPENPVTSLSINGFPPHYDDAIDSICYEAFCSKLALSFVEYNAKKKRTMELISSVTFRQRKQSINVFMFSLLLFVCEFFSFRVLWRNRD